MGHTYTCKHGRNHDSFLKVGRTPMMPVAGWGNEHWVVVKLKATSLSTAILQLIFMSLNWFNLHMFSASVAASTVFDKVSSAELWWRGESTWQKPEDCGHNIDIRVAPQTNMGLVTGNEGNGYNNKRFTFGEAPPVKQYSQCFRAHLPTHNARRLLPQCSACCALDLSRDLSWKEDEKERLVRGDPPIIGSGFIHCCSFVCLPISWEEIDWNEQYECTILYFWLCL